MSLLVKHEIKWSHEEWAGLSLWGAHQVMDEGELSEWMKMSKLNEQKKWKEHERDKEVLKYIFARTKTKWARARIDT